MTQRAKRNPQLSIHRAFVVHFGVETDVEKGQVEGRVEHVVSGQPTHFFSLAELLAFVTQVLSQVRAKRREKT